MPNGCHNRAPLRNTVMVPAGWSRSAITGISTKLTKVIPDPMSKECNYSLSKDGMVDAGCDGCKWRRHAQSEV